MGIREPRVIGFDMAVVTAARGARRDKAVAALGGTMKELRLPSPRL
jgi:hypothetical protein